MIPGKVDISENDAAKLRALNDKLGAIQSWVGVVQAQAERRMAELQAEARDVWADIAIKHKLDLERVKYDLDKDGKAIIPISMRLV